MLQKSLATGLCAAEIGIIDIPHFYPIVAYRVAVKNFSDCLRRLSF